MVSAVITWLSKAPPSCLFPSSPLKLFSSLFYEYSRTRVFLIPLRVLLKSVPVPRNALDNIYSYSYTRENKMAKGATKAGAVLVRLVSTLDTGFFYVKRKNPKKIPHKLEFRKYDAKARKHCLFVESKQK